MQSMIENAYISLEIDSRKLEPLRQHLLRRLQQSGVRAERPERNPHVSIGYTLGRETEARMQGLARAIAALGIELNVCHLEVLHGLATPFDYIVLKLEGGSGFQEALKCVEGSCETKKFPGGFKAHVTLLQIPKGMAAEKNDSDDLCRCMRDCWSDCAMDLETRICGRCVAIFDDQKRRRIECEVPMAA